MLMPNGAATASPNRPLTWFITGTSSGFGYRLSLIALNRGDRVIATARSLPKLQKLIDEVSKDESNKERFRTMRVDLSDSEEVMQGVAKEAVDVWGGIDVLVNNAGWGQPSIAEEQGAFAIQHLIDTNVMGTVKITFAILPYMRAQKSGTIVTIGSRSSWRAELPGIGSYAMVKGAVHAFTENLSSELAPLNIRTLLVEPGAFRTEGIYSHGWDERNPISDYEDLRNRARAIFGAVPGNERGDPLKAMNVIADVVRGEGVARGRPWPKYLILGDDADTAVRTKCNLMLSVLEEWKDVTKGVNFD